MASLGYQKLVGYVANEYCLVVAPWRCHFCEEAQEEVYRSGEIVNKRGLHEEHEEVLQH